MDKKKTSKENSEAVKNGFGIQAIISKGNTTINYDKLAQIRRLMDRTQRDLACPQ